MSFYNSLLVRLNLTLIQIEYKANVNPISCFFEKKSFQNAFLTKIAQVILAANDVKCE